MTRKTNAHGKRDRRRELVRRLSRMAGGSEQLIHGRKRLIRWIDEEIKAPPPARGRPLNDFFHDLSISDGPAEGLYLVRFKIGNAAPNVVAIVRPQKHRLKPGDPRKTWVELKCEEKYGKNFQFPTINQAIRKIVETVWRAHQAASLDRDLSPVVRAALNPRRLGWHIDATTRRLTKELRRQRRL